MIRILDRLVVRTFLKLFVVFLMAAPLLFVLGDYTENLGTYLDRGLSRAEVAHAYLYQLPMFIQWSFPVAALIAAVFTIHGMTTHREVVAAKAGGISFHRIALPVVVTGLVLTGVALVLTEVVPRTNRVAAEILQARDPRRSWRTDFVYESDDGLTWQVGRLTADDGRMTDVVLERSPDAPNGGLYLTAKSATWDSIHGWTMQEGYERRLMPDSSERTFEFKKLRMAGVAERPEALLEEPREPEEMTYKEITRQARIVERTGGNARKLLVKRAQKLSIPVATLVVILFGIPLATSTGRGSTAFGIGVSLGTTMVYMLVLKVAAALGQAGAMDPLLAAWLPNTVFFAGALVLMKRVRT
ncbi:MAG: LptF/LptG family permease [Gemmatimonadota bacterium]|jgi:lipopolysaccharide export system permease protein